MMALINDKTVIPNTCQPSFTKSTINSKTNEVITAKVKLLFNKKSPRNVSFALKILLLSVAFAFSASAK